MERPASHDGATPEALRVLLGGVPFGRDNIGDEAIVECVAEMVRDAAPNAHVAICCDNTATAQRLGLATEPLLGFLEPWTGLKAIQQVLSDYDVWIWAGATGLSDYPHVGIQLLEAAERQGLRRILFGVGMNSELNPALYRLGPGWKRSALEKLASITGGALRPVEWLDRRRDSAMRLRISRALSAADLIIVRDVESRDELGRGSPGWDPSRIGIGADPALRIRPMSPGELPLTPGERRLLSRSARRIGICISAQRPVTHGGELAKMVGEWLDEPAAAVFGIPMNPETDAEWLRNLRAETPGAERFVVVENCRTPAAVAGLAGQMDVVVSSRLHLLILAAISRTPLAGIGRGSKVASFLKPFHLEPAGEAENVDFTRLHGEVQRLLDRDQAEAFREKAAEALRDFGERLRTMDTQLRHALA
ncbi:MAG TPA: polysaccharide pyruvyl transferase family protein [Verrucomicrobiales bacterium]|nr:polysaccharide pyruvyl transferase family protein [Verrucomicrobiales bacterium]